MTLPYNYLPAVMYAIDLIGQGHTLTAACDASNISVPTFWSYVNKTPELQTAHADAVQRGADAMADALVNIDNHRIHGQSNPQMAKVVSDNIKWLLARRDPHKYGDRVTVDHNVTVDVAITTALNAARRRTDAVSQIDNQAEDAVVLEDEDEDAALLAQLLS